MSGAVQHGSVNQSVTIQICAEDGTPKEDVVYNTTDLALWYRRSGGIKVDIELATLSALTDTHSDGGFLHIDDGAYRLDVQDAAYASGANELLIGGSVPSGVVIPVKIPLVAYDPQTVRVGAAAAGAQMDLVNAPNATAVAAIQSGLSTSSGVTSAFTEIKGATWSSLTDTLEAIRDFVGGGGGESVSLIYTVNLDSEPMTPVVLKQHTGETKTQQFGVYNYVSGVLVPLDMTSILSSLQFNLADKNGNIIQTVSNSSMAVTGDDNNVVQVPVTIGDLKKNVTYSYSLRATTGGKRVYGFGDYKIFYAP